MRKIWTVAAVVLLAMVTALGAEAVEQRAFALEEMLTLYAKPDKEAKSWEVSLPDSGVAVPSAIRDKKDMLWYKVKVDGRTGWLYQEGVRLRMGPKSKVAANLYKRYAAARLKIADKTPEGWTQEESIQAGGADVDTWTSKGAVFQISGEGKRAKDLYFKANTASACKVFLGFEAVGMSMDELRSKVGTPTVRETPSGEPEISILSYELPDHDLTLVFTLRDQVVESAEFHRGETGEGEQGWTGDVLDLRKLD